MNHDTCYFMFRVYNFECTVMRPLALILQYRPYFPSSVKELAVFIDLAPKFQLLAEEVLQRQIQLVMSNLKQVIFCGNRDMLYTGLFVVSSSHAYLQAKSFLILLCCNFWSTRLSMEPTDFKIPTKRNSSNLPSFALTRY